jgi:hypothetical protein
LFGSRHRRQRIERRQDEALFVLGQLDVGHRHARFVAREPELDAEVAVDHVARRAVDQDLGHPADLGQSAGQRTLLLRRMRPPVPRVRDQVSWWHVGVADDPITPSWHGRGFRGARHPMAGAG